MANEIRLDESITSFGGTGTAGGGGFIPVGPISRFFKKFYSDILDPDSPLRSDKKSYETLKGDTITTTDVLYKEGYAVFSRSPGAIVLPQIELNRKRRYQDYEAMDEYPEIGAAFDIYADDCSQKDTKNKDWKIESENQSIVEEIENFFKIIKLDNQIWDIARNTVKYGDCFLELIVNLKKEENGIQQVKILNPNFILRVENEYGRLIEFLQEIPEDKAPTDYFNDPTQSKYIKLHKKQIVHFRIASADPSFYPYGRSIAALAHRTFRSLKMMEDAMLIYRLSRAPERRIFYIDVGGLPTQKAELFIERIKEKFKKEKFYNTTQGTMDARYNPMSADEDFFVPIRGQQGTKIETLPGGQNLGDIDDVKYFRDKILASLKVPKDYIVEHDKSPERKANLSQLDVKFARAVKRVQKSLEVGLENMARRHLELKKYPASLIRDIRIRLPEPSDLSAKRKLDIDEQKARCVQAVLGLQLFPKKTIYKEYYDMTDADIEQVEKDLEKEMEEMAEKGMMGMGGGMPGAGGPMGGGMPGMPGEGGPPGMDQPGYGEAGGQEGAENKPPTKNESHIEKLKARLPLNEQTDHTHRVLSRIIQREKAKLISSNQ